MIKIDRRYAARRRFFRRFMLRGGWFTVQLSLTGLNWVQWLKPGSDKARFLLQWDMPKLEWFIINEL
jgi:hypothetical protein